ncbi:MULTISPECIES: hypothetical protein [unclassified Rhodococcus (in: high G+C Gram-positive bacteria)]|uniref:hypothetical protein n=1 Tax=unclassified Rhodococcus (in: high G+C Gram-positive bacteria) TaxID=192944 RepID=UPI0018A71432|nr:hypothetical protein [Rhodococcus sp. M8]QPG47356.1 hypothetical protein ISO16_10370 [Rhodococcus sp. M8]
MRLDLGLIVRTADRGAIRPCRTGLRWWHEDGESDRNRLPRRNFDDVGGELELEEILGVRTAQLETLRIVAASIVDLQLDLRRCPVPEPDPLRFDVELSGVADRWHRQRQSDVGGGVRILVRMYSDRQRESLSGRPSGCIDHDADRGRLLLVGIEGDRGMRQLQPARSIERHRPEAIDDRGDVVHPQIERATPFRIDRQLRSDDLDAGRTRLTVTAGGAPARGGGGSTSNVRTGSTIRWTPGRHHRDLGRKCAPLMGARSRLEPDEPTAANAEFGIRRVDGAAVAADGCDIRVRDPF